jgi:hypothetical protein
MTHALVNIIFLAVLAGAVWALRSTVRARLARIREALRG